MKIVWNNEDPYRAANRYFAYSNVSPKGEQVGTWGSCKNFPVERYSRHAAGLEFDIPRIIFHAPYSTKLTSYDVVLDLVNQLDSILGFEPSRYELLIETPWPDIHDTYWEGDPRYMTAPPLFGLWLMVMRNTENHKIGDPFTNTMKYGRDYRWWYVIEPMINFIAKHGPEEVFGTDKSLNWCPIGREGDATHDSGGPYEYATGASKPYFKHWRFPGE